MGNFSCFEKRDPSTSEDLEPKKVQKVPLKIPSQNYFHFDDLSLDSKFECGNLMLAEKVKTNEFDLWIAPDCFQTNFETEHRVWFYFRAVPILQNGEDKVVTFRIKNFNKNQTENFKKGLLPVYCAPSTGNTWRHIPNQIGEFQIVKSNVEITFEFRFTQQDAYGVQFAFTFPYKYTDCMKFTKTITDNFAKDPELYIKREIAIKSLEGRDIEMLTITGSSTDQGEEQESEGLIPEMFPENKPRPVMFKHKKYVFLTCRVHPGESPANLILESFLQELLNKQNELSRRLLQNFVFVVIPMLNPDGVSRGHYRCDTKGRDLNRFYDKLDSKEHPGPYAAMQIAKQLADGRLFIYLDLHSHSQKDSGFVFANYDEDKNIRAECRTFGRLFDIYSRYFDYNSCGFGQPLPNPIPSSKIGVGKTEIGKATKVVHCYTLESGYHRSLKDPYRYNLQLNPDQDLKRKHVTRFSQVEFQELGDALRNVLGELVGIHPQSILEETVYKNLEGIKSKELEELSKAPNADEAEEN